MKNDIEFICCNKVEYFLTREDFFLKKIKKERLEFSDNYHDSIIFNFTTGLCMENNKEKFIGQV